MRNFSPEQQLSPESRRLLDGVSFITELGATFPRVAIEADKKDLSVFEAFQHRPDLQEIIAFAKDFKKKHQEAGAEIFNGVLLGNPNFKNIHSGDTLDITAERLHYLIYFGAHDVRQRKPEMKEMYGALSVAGVVYDSGREAFYLSRRPLDSAEDPGKLDAPGGTINPEASTGIDAYGTEQDRLNRKLGFGEDTLDSLNCIGVERIFDSHYSLYNVAFMGEVKNQQPTVAADRYGEIAVSEVESLLNSDQLTTPAKATLLLALSNDRFKEFGWGADRVRTIIPEEIK